MLLASRAVSEHACYSIAAKRAGAAVAMLRPLGNRTAASKLVTSCFAALAHAPCDRIRQHAQHTTHLAAHARRSGEGRHVGSACLRRSGTKRLGKTIRARWSGARLGRARRDEGAQSASAVAPRRECSGGRPGNAIRGHQNPRAIKALNWGAGAAGTTQHQSRRPHATRFVCLTQCCQVSCGCVHFRPCW